MPERAEFHPLAVRAVTWLIGLLTPRLRREHAATDHGVILQRADVVASLRGASVAIACTQWLMNRSAAAIQLQWAIPQPASASAWLAPQQSIELISNHAYVLKPPLEKPASALRMQVDAALPIGAAVLRRTGRAACLTVGRRPAPQLQLQALLGALARLSRHASAGVVCHNAAGDQAVFRGTLAGCAVRLRLELCS